MKKVMLVSVLSTGVVLAGTALALNNDGAVVRRVEALSGDRVFLHVKSKISAKPNCAKHDNIVACSLKDAYCSEAMKVALGARLSGEPVDFEVTNECVGDVAKFSRIRF